MIEIVRAGKIKISDCQLYFIGMIDYSKSSKVL